MKRTLVLSVALSVGLASACGPAPRPHPPAGSQSPSAPSAPSASAPPAAASGSAPAPSASSAAAPPRSGVHCLADAPPDGIYDAPPGCAAPECKEPGRLRVAVIGGCIGLAREDGPQASASIQIEQQPREPAAVVVRRPTFIGGCDRGREARLTRSGDTLAADVRTYDGCTKPGPAERVALARVETIPPRTAAQHLGDPRREVVAAALELSAASPSKDACPPWSALLTPARIESDHSLTKRALALALDPCLAPAAERALAHGRLADRAADTLAAMTSPEERAQALVRLVQGANAATAKMWAGADEGIVRLAWSFKKQPPPGLPEALVRIARGAPTPAVARVAVSSIAALLEPDRLPATLFEAARTAGCAPRVELYNHDLSFDAMLRTSDEELLARVVPVLDDVSCGAASKRLAYLTGARFAHRGDASNLAFQKVREVAQRRAGIRASLRDGLLCGGSRCDTLPTCHSGDRTHVAPDRDALLRDLGVTMCP